MTKLKKTAGIDISKLFFDVCLLCEDGTSLCNQFSNDASGFKKAATWIGPAANCVMEATGPYYLRLAVYLHLNGYQVSVVNPLVIKRFCQMRLLRAKTDKVDAALIASYGSSESLQVWTPPHNYTVTLKQLMALDEELVKQHTSLCNQLEAFSCAAVMDKETKKLYSAQLAFNKNSQAAVQKRMDTIVQQHYRELQQRLTSIPGLGKKTIITLIVVTEGFTRFENHKQLSAYFGLSPRIYQSGSSIKGRAAICKMGMSRVRAMLYLCSWSAVKYNEGCRQFYQRLLQKNKSKQLALIAVSNKLIKQAFAIAKNNSMYDPNYQKNICF
jgi:transposase